MGRQKTLVYSSFTVLFIASAFWFFQFDNGIFSFQENQSLFIFSFDYLQKYSLKPGGLLEYAANFLTQGYFNLIYGSLIVASIIVLPGFVYIRTSRQLSADRSHMLPIIILPSFLLLLLQTSYDYHMYYNLGYLAVVYWLFFSVIIMRRGYWWIILVLFPVFSYLTGSFALIYLVTIIVYCIVWGKSIRRYLQPILLILSALLTFLFFKEVLFLQPSDRLLGYPLPILSFSEITPLFYLLIGYVIFLPLTLKIYDSIRMRFNLSAIFPVITVLVLFVSFGFLLITQTDLADKEIIEYEKFVYKQDWDAIIKRHESTPSTNIAGQFYYNVALSEKGQLCERLFLSRQDFGLGALALPHNDRLLDRDVYFYYAVGLIGEAHHLAVESIVRHGYCPESLKFLVKTELIYGNRKVAERFINVLKKTFHYREWAENYEKSLKDSSILNSDTDLLEKQKLLPGKDFFVSPNDMENIDLLLAANSGNKKAFEYKMAGLLFDKNIEGVIHEAKKMKTMGYSSIPRYIEEAIVEELLKKNKIPDTVSIPIRNETETRFKKYMDDFKKYNNASRSVFEEKMKNSWGNTFWFYKEFR